MKGGYKHNLDLDDDNDSWSSDSLRNQSSMALPPSTVNSGNPPHSPIDPSVPLFPAGGRGPPPNYQDNPRNIYQGHPESRPNSDLPLMSHAGRSAAAPYDRVNSSTSNLSGYRSQHNASPAFRQQNNAR
jgi:hypothetical protein